MHWTCEGWVADEIISVEVKSCPETKRKRERAQGVTENVNSVDGLLD